MMRIVKVNPDSIKPSQDFLKPGTIRHIISCIKTGDIENIPPTPIVRMDENDELIAIDGHNLLAVKSYLHEEVDVHIATSANDGLSPTDVAAGKRNEELNLKYEDVINFQKAISSKGINTFKDLTDRYQELFDEVA